MGRVFTSGERRQIRESNDPERTLWSVWTGKETAYKAIRRAVPSVTSAPGRYEVAVCSSGASLPERGTVYTPCGPISLRFSSTADYVHCVGATTQEEIDTITWDIGEIPRNQQLCDGGSNFVRHMAKRNISVLLDTEPEAIAIIRPKGNNGLAPPEVRTEETMLPVILSMSHDGRFAACAFTISPRTEHRY